MAVRGIAPKKRRALDLLSPLGWPENVGAPFGAAIAGGLVYLLRDEFTTTQAAPLTSPRTAEPGPGNWTVVQTTGNFSISGAALNFPAASGGNGSDCSIYDATPYAPVGGLVLVASIKWTNVSIGTISGLIGVYSSTALDFGNALLTLAAGRAGSPTWFEIVPGFFSANSQIANATYYPVAFVITPTQIYAFSYINSAWNLEFVRTHAAAQVYFGMGVRAGSAGSVDYARIATVGGVFANDYGIATVNVTSFTQSLGAELLTNGNFAAWTAGDPDSWTEVGESGTDPEITEVAAANAHGGGGTGAANLYSSATNNAPGLQQAILTAGAIYESQFNITKYTSGNLKIGDSTLLSANNNNSAGIRKRYFRAANTTLYIRGSDTAPIDITIDDVSVKVVTLNAAQNVGADGIFDFEGAMNASPTAGDELHLMYRMPAAGSEFADGWDAYIVRNDANSANNARLDSIVSGTRTNRIAVNGIADTNVRVITNGNLHDFYTRSGTTWAKRGSQINNSTQAASTWMNAIYSSNAAPTRMAFYPRTSSAYNVLSQV